MIRNTDHGFRRKNDGPRRVRNGVRLRTRGDAPHFPWPAQPWFEAIIGDAPTAVKEQGLEFARKGQTISLEIQPSHIVATIQDVAAKPYTVQIEVDSISRRDWDRVVNSVAKEARYAAKFITGDITCEIVRPFEELGLPVLPSGDDVSIKCSCNIPCCKHSATVAYLVAERMEQDPLMILTLRGLYGPRFLERLQEARLLATSGVSRAHPVPPAASVARDLPKFEDMAGDIWSAGSSLSEFERSIRSQHAPHALLRRLGMTPMKARFPLVGLLASIYDSVAESTREQLQEIDNAAAEALPPPPEDSSPGQSDPYASS